MSRTCLALSLLLVVAAPVAAAGSAVPVTLGGFVGLPADSTDRREFMLGFMAAMEAELPCERRAGEAWSATDPKQNPFRLVDMAPPDATWTLELSIGLPPPVRVPRPKPKGSKFTPRPRMSDVRASRGLTIVAVVHSPTTAAHGTLPEPLRFAVYFADARRVLVPSAKVPGGGYSYPWADAGRVVARAALEALQRARGEMAEDERADLAPATRAEVTR